MGNYPAQVAVTNMAVQATTRRIVWLDNAKAYGIFIVFYGHLLEVIYLNYNPSIFPQFKFIYSFHMPLFFILAGFVYRARSGGFSQFLRTRFAGRIVPFLFFNLLGLACLLLVHQGQGLFKPENYLQGLWALLLGRPAFNMLTWFLVCLFTVELIHFGLKRFLTSTPRLLLTAAIFMLGGLLLTRMIATQGTLLGIPKNIWYIHEATVAYGFYLLGILFRRFSQAGYRLGPRKGFLLIVLLGLITWFTYDLNTGPFVTEVEAILMVLSSHGSLLFFPLSAVAGSLFIIFLARLTPALPPLLYFGQNTLILLGLNGLFFEFFNRTIVIAVGNGWGATLGMVTLQTMLITILSLVICVPFIHFLDKYLPQLVGKPKRNGPILPPFVK